jgi:hypothetical protein
MVDITELGLDEALGAHPELTARLKAGDPAAFAEILEVIGGPGGNVTVHTQHSRLTGMDALARLGLHPRDEAERELRAVAAERRLAARLVEVETADAEDRLFELVKDVPSVRDQLREFID